MSEGRRSAGDGSWSRDPGKTALALYALAHSGVPADDRALVRGLYYLIGSLVRPDNYDASTAIMALATIDPEGQKKRIRESTREK